MHETPTVTEPSKPEHSLKEKWDGLLFDVRRSVRYHNYRRKFFDFLSTWTNFLIIISGTSVVSFASRGEGGSPWVKFFGALAAILAALDLVIGFSTKSRDYNDLAKDFSRLEIAMNKIGDAYTNENFFDMFNTRLAIEQNEPPIKRVLDIYCWNELSISMGHDKSELYDIKLYQRLFMQFCDIAPQGINKFSSKKQIS
jgi:hypothetical protein